MPISFKFKIEPFRFLFSPYIHASYKMLKRKLQNNINWKLTNGEKIAIYLIVFNSKN